MSNDTIQYVEAVIGREFGQPELLFPFFFPVYPDQPIDDRYTDEWFADFASWLEREYPIV